MNKAYLLIITLFAAGSCAPDRSQVPDWLIDGSSFRSEITEENGSVTMANGLVSRTISLSPDGATTGFTNLMTGNELIRAVKPEALIAVNGKSLKVGGLAGQPVNNYLTQEWITNLEPDTASSFTLSGYKTMDITARFPWKKRAEWMAQDMPWPPKGKQGDFTYKDKVNRLDVADIEVVIHYEIYDGIPLISKWQQHIPDTKVLLMVYNPLDHDVQQNLTINVYYTGLARAASVSENGGNTEKYEISRNFEITIPVRVEKNSQS